MFQAPMEDFDLRPFATGELIVDPHNVIHLNADGNLMSQAWTCELVRVPLLADICHKQSWPLNLEIGTIDANFAACSSILTEHVLPFDLKESSRKSMRQLFKPSCPMLTTSPCTQQKIHHRGYFSGNFLQ
jgi:hypothetical protein